MLAFAVEEAAAAAQALPAAPVPAPQVDDLFHRLVMVTHPAEKTCLGCGETFMDKMCPRCGLYGPGEEQNHGERRPLPPAVLTTSYLRPEEYRLVTR